MRNKHLFIILVILLNSCKFIYENNDSPTEKTPIKADQITLHTVRGQGDYLTVTGLSANAVIKVREYPYSTTIINGIMEPITGGGGYKIYFFK
jgi:hypothetical protein